VSQTETIVDYAHPAMMAEKALRDMHEAALEKRFKAAQEFALTAITESRLALQALRHMEQK